MKRKLGSMLAVFLMALGIGVAITPAASASNYSTSGCTGVFVEYESVNQTVRYVKWAESRNICGAYAGHFQTYGVNDADRNPIATHRVNIYQNMNRGICIRGTGWRNDGGGNYYNMGSACTLIA